MSDAESETMTTSDPVHAESSENEVTDPVQAKGSENEATHTGTNQAGGETMSDLV